MEPPATKQVDTIRQAPSSRPQQRSNVGRMEVAEGLRIGPEHALNQIFGCFGANVWNSVLRGIKTQKAPPRSWGKTPGKGATRKWVWL